MGNHGGVFLFEGLGQLLIRAHRSERAEVTPPFLFVMIFGDMNQALFVQAVRCHQGGQIGEAERLYRLYLETDPNHADGLHLLGVVHTQTGRHAEARQLIGRAIELRPDAAPFHSNLGASLRALGLADAAVASYRQALRLKPDYPDAHNHLGATLRDLGQWAEAEAEVREAIRLRPDYADAHNNLGNILRETGRAAASEASYRSALRLTPPGHPKFGQILVNLGTALRDAGRLDDAEQAYRRALAANPGDADLHAHLGVVLRDAGALGEAAAGFRKVVVLAPGSASAYNDLGTTERGRGRLDTAEMLCLRALRLDAGLAEAHHGVATILFDLGRFAEAETHFDAALRIDPQNAVFRYNMTGARKFKPGDRQIGELDTLLKDGKRSRGDLVHLHFALAKALDDIGDKDGSFAHQLEGNALKRRDIVYDEPATLARMSRIAEIFSSEVMPRARPGAPRGPIFIVGMPRSGSTLVEQILASHPEVHGGGEVPLLGRAVSDIFGAGIYPEIVSKIGPETLQRLGQAYRTALHRDVPIGLRVTDKMLGNFLFCGLIALTFPDARIIHATRDPIDNCLSIFSKLFVGQINYSYDLAELGRYYAAYRTLMAHWRNVLPAGVMIDLVYEQVVGDLEGEARRILDHCGLAWNDAVLEFHRTDRAVRTASATQVRQPIYKSSVGRWRPDAELLKPLTDSLLTYAAGADTMINK